MSDAHTEQLGRLLAEYREQQQALLDVQSRLKDIRATATAPRRSVSVTAGHGGGVEEIKFPTAAYKRMAPAELAAALVDTIAAAQRKAADEAADLMAPHMPPGFDAKAVVAGELDPAMFEIPELGPNRSLNDLLSGPPN
ncbi:YbaB/EbfC family nucleoid-associated protein [Saccharothrix sp. Mg75]|uniref:YbaB/EbfC family nucleoid-associated protein n=1 Tax=Saccharothrix sp. Mg75 TaxID=3445357 RepID=UPI003EEA72EA